tara:strand:- start:258 stop:437 length:180 start_codon:yes stop_codon:yes gene_type:complete
LVQARIFADGSWKRKLRNAAQYHTRAIDHIAQSKELWQLANGQLFINLDMSEENTPPGT